LDQGNLFSYLSAFVTIVLAVAMADMIHSAHRLIRARARIRWDALPLLFAAIVALFLITEFFSLWTRFDVSQVSMLRLLWLLATPTVFTFLAYSALPDEVPPEGLDLAGFYMSQRRLWAVMFAAGALLDLMRSLEYVVLEGVAPRAADLIPAGLTLLMLAGPALMYLSRSRRVNWIAVLWLVPFVALAVMDEAITA
jgi:hypothetical protein